MPKALAALGALNGRAMLGFRELLLPPSSPNSVSFAVHPYDVPNELFMPAYATVPGSPSWSNYRDNDLITCAEGSAPTGTGDATVVLIFSTCMNSEQLSTVSSWAEQVVTNVVEEVGSDGPTLAFASTMVPGACEDDQEALTKDSTAGTATWTKWRLANNDMSTIPERYKFTCAPSGSGCVSKMADISFKCTGTVEDCDRLFGTPPDVAKPGDPSVCTGLRQSMCEVAVVAAIGHSVPASTNAVSTIPERYYFLCGSSVSECENKLNDVKAKCTGTVADCDRLFGTPPDVALTGGPSFCVGLRTLPCRAALAGALGVAVPSSSNDMSTIPERYTFDCELQGLSVAECPVYLANIETSICKGKSMEWCDQKIGKPPDVENNGDPSICVGLSATECWAARATAASVPVPVTSLNPAANNNRITVPERYRFLCEVKGEFGAACPSYLYKTQMTNCKKKSVAQCDQNIGMPPDVQNDGDPSFCVGLTLTQCKSAISADLSVAVPSSSNDMSTIPERYTFDCELQGLSAAECPVYLASIETSICKGKSMEWCDQKIGKPPDVENNGDPSICVGLSATECWAARATAASVPVPATSLNPAANNNRITVPERYRFLCEVKGEFGAACPSYLYKTQMTNCKKKSVAQCDQNIGMPPDVQNDGDPSFCVGLTLTECWAAKAAAASVPTPATSARPVATNDPATIPERYRFVCEIRGISVLHCPALLFTIQTTYCKSTNVRECDQKVGRPRDVQNDGDPSICVGLELKECDNRIAAQQPIQVDPQKKMKQLKEFPALGSVLQTFADAKQTQAAAVIGFVTDKTSYAGITQYENNLQVSKTFNFKFCEVGVDCESANEAVIPLDQDVDLFMYNPFTVTRSLSCDALDDGVPVTYMATDDTRHCFCSCPAGSEQQTDSESTSEMCVSTGDDSHLCAWSAMKGFTKKISSLEDTCSFDEVVSSWGLPVPMPTDGYVLNSRTSIQKDIAKPRVDVHVVRMQDPEYEVAEIISAIGSFPLPTQLTDVVALDAPAIDLTPLVPSAADTSVHDSSNNWQAYQSNHDAVLDSMTFTSFGKYRLSVDAYDYVGVAMCEGCMAIIDDIRPKATTTCPEGFSDLVEGAVVDTDTAELTMTNLATVNALMKQYFSFANNAKNDACGNNRCDELVFKARNFYESTYSDKSDSHGDALSFWDADVSLGHDWLEHDTSSKNPLLTSDGSCDNTVQPVLAGQCTRCSEMYTALQEHWTDYRCGADFDVTYCSGDSSQTCSWTQCLVMHGDTLATVTAKLKDAVVAESKAVLEHVEHEGWQTITQVHRLLDCTSFAADLDDEAEEEAGTCEFKTKLSELVETTQRLELDVPGADVAKIVHWRYKVESEDQKWRLWQDASGTDDELRFVDPETKVSVEAWTQCGLVRRFFFYVHLHVANAVDVCDQFSAMWYQTSISRLPVATDMCAYPGSDFAELTFDFHPNLGLQYSSVQLQRNVSEVVCEGRLEGRSAVEILRVTSASPEFVKRFAVQMLSDATTEAATAFRVSCDFKFAQLGGSERTETCSRDFSITDCEAPAFGGPNGECEFIACAGSSDPGPYEACGGTIVSATSSATEVTTGTAKSCCQGCADTTVVCTPLLGLPDAVDDVMRCEPQSTRGAYTSSVTTATRMTQAMEAHPTAMALLTASTLVAVAALVVVYRRVAASRSALADRDIYLPLMS